MFSAPASMPQAHGCQPDPSNKCPHPPSCRITSVSSVNPQICMYSIVRNVPSFRVANRANMSAEPQHNAVANPSKIPMMNVQDFDFFGGASPSSAITFCRSFQTSAFAGGFRSRYAG